MIGEECGHGVPTPSGEGAADDPPEERVADSGAGEQDRRPVQPRIVAADHERELGDDDGNGGERRDRLRQEQQPWSGELDDVAAQGLTLVPPAGHEVGAAAQRVRHRLRLMVIVHGGEVTPGRVPAHLDHSGTEFDADDEPAQQQDHRQSRGHLVGAEEADEEPCFEQQRFPAEPVEALPDRHDREVQCPHA